MTTPLNLNHVHQIMCLDIMIGSAPVGIWTPNKSSKKKFCFNPQENEFRIYLDGKYLTGGQDIEALLEEYNNL